MGDFVVLLIGLIVVIAAVLAVIATKGDGRSKAVKDPKTVADVRRAIESLPADAYVIVVREGDDKQYAIDDMAIYPFALGGFVEDGLEVRIGEFPKVPRPGFDPPETSETSRSDNG